MRLHFFNSAVIGNSKLDYSLFMLKNGGWWLLTALFIFVVVTFLFTQYGYRLPAEENVFYNVRFYYIRGKIFTYP